MTTIERRTSALTTPQPAASPVSTQPPRELTAAVRRRAWMEPHVRFWWVGATALLVIAAWMLAVRAQHWLENVRLIHSGVEVRAQIVEANGSTLPNKTEPGDSWVKLQYTYKGNMYRPVTMLLEGHSSAEPIIVGTSIPIHIDPNQPDRWTPRLSAPPLAQDLIGGGIVLAAAVLVLLISLWQRASVLRTWRDGTLVPTLVLSARHTALAPRAWNIRCTPADPQDKRVFNVFVPPGTDISQGATVQVLINGSGGRPVASRILAPASSDF